MVYFDKGHPTNHLNFTSLFFVIYYIMPVPKKRLSKAKTRTRKSLWKQEAQDKAQKALSLALSLLKRRLPEKADATE